MFEIDSERTALPLSPDRILALVASLNAPMVVAADMPVEPTRAYVCAYRDGVDHVRFSIYLHCVESNKGAFYRYDGGAIARARFDEVMGEAMAFAESLGFMMDDLGWEGLDPARREALVRETPMFQEPAARAGATVDQASAAEPPVELIVDDAADAGVVGAMPISPIPPAPPAAAPPAPPPAAPAPPPVAPPAAAAPAPAAARVAAPAAAPAAAPPLETVFVPPPLDAPAAARPPADSGVREIELPAAPPAPPAAARPPADSGVREIELPAAPPAPPAAARPPADSGVREIELPAAPPEPPPAPVAPAAPPRPAAPSRQAARPAAPPVAVAQALVRLLASL